MVYTSTISTLSTLYTLATLCTAGNISMTLPATQSPLSPPSPYHPHTPHCPHPTQYPRHALHLHCLHTTHALHIRTQRTPSRSSMSPHYTHPPVSHAYCAQYPVHPHGIKHNQTLLTQLQQPTYLDKQFPRYLVRHCGHSVLSAILGTWYEIVALCACTYAAFRT